MLSNTLRQRIIVRCMGLAFVETIYAALEKVGVWSENGALPHMTLTDLDKFLSRHKRVSQNTAKWRGGIELQVTGYVCSEAAPASLVSSVRAIVFKEDRVLVTRNLDGTHILPGGRVEEGETHDETLHRELLEEAAVEIKVMAQIGLVDLKHVTPKPKGYPYLYPDFLWPVYIASFVRQGPEAEADDDYEIASEFLPLQEVRRLALDQHAKAFLEAAVEAVHPTDWGQA